MMHKYVCNEIIYKRNARNRSMIKLSKKRIFVAISILTISGSAGSVSIKSSFTTSRKIQIHTEFEAGKGQKYKSHVCPQYQTCFSHGVWRRLENLLPLLWHIFFSSL